VPKRKPPTKLSDRGPKYVRLTDLPARLKIEPPRSRRFGEPRVMLEFSVERYEVPDDGADVLDFESDD